MLNSQMADIHANITQIQRGFNFFSITIELHQIDQITIKYIICILLFHVLSCSYTNCNTVNLILFRIIADHITSIPSTHQKQNLDEVSRLRFELESSIMSVEELQDAISIERQQCLSWMEKHNKVLTY